MTELQELTEGKTIPQLEAELKYQLSMGETLGGTICSHIYSTLSIKKEEARKLLLELFSFDKASEGRLLDEAELLQRTKIIVALNKLGIMTLLGTLQETIPTDLLNWIEGQIM